MAGVSWIEYQSKKILFIDFKGCQSETDMLEIVYKAQKIIRTIDGEYLQLSDVTTVFATPKFMRELKNVAKETPSDASKRAIVGITNRARSILLQTYAMLLTKNAIKPFNTLEEAKDWLVS